MKIRIKGNSIRYRLTQTDIRNMRDKGSVEEKTEFPDGNSFSYRLESATGIEEIQTSFGENRIIIFVPLKMANEWTGSDTVGLSNEINLPGNKKLSLLIEKDFACIDHTHEDQSDMYPNPNKTC